VQKQGHEETLCYLGNIQLELGNVRLALIYIKRAAKRDHPESVFNLRNIYKEGNGLECNVKKKVLTGAAEQVYAPAQYILRLLYDVGEVAFNKTIDWQGTSIIRLSHETTLQLEALIVYMMPPGLLA